MKYVEDGDSKHFAKLCLNGMTEPLSQDGDNVSVNVVQDKFKNEYYSKVNPSSLIAFMYANCGAQGDGGRLEMFFVDGKTLYDIRGNYLTDGEETIQFLELLPKFFVKGKSQDKDWDCIRLGLGNFLAVKRIISGYIRNASRKDVYQNYPRLIMEAVIVNSAKYDEEL